MKKLALAAFLATPVAGCASDRIESIEYRLSTLERQVASNARDANSRLGSLATSVSAAVGDISRVQTRLGNAETRVASVENRTTSNEQRLRTVECDTSRALYESVVKEYQSFPGGEQVIPKRSDIDRGRRDLSERLSARRQRCGN